MKAIVLMAGLTGLMFGVAVTDYKLTNDHEEVMQTYRKVILDEHLKDWVVLGDHEYKCMKKRND